MNVIRTFLVCEKEDVAPFISAALAATEKIPSWSYDVLQATAVPLGTGPNQLFVVVSAMFGYKMT
jgi:hypothetical protein